MFCDQCGTKLRDGALFCHQCGTAMADNELSQAVASPKVQPENRSNKATPQNDMPSDEFPADPRAGNRKVMIRAFFQRRGVRPFSRLLVLLFGFFAYGLSWAWERQFGPIFGNVWVSGFIRGALILAPVALWWEYTRRPEEPSPFQIDMALLAAGITAVILFLIYF